MNNERTLTFSLQRKFPEDFPVDRLARYLRLVSELFGSGGQVRLKSISRGSVLTRFTTEESYYPEAVLRITSSDKPDAPHALKRVRQELQEMIEDDAVDAKIANHVGAKIMFLRGYKKKKSAKAFGPIRDSYSVRGRVIGLEGKDETKHVRIAEFATNKEIRGEVRDHDLALRLKDWLFTPSVVEISGTAALKRTGDGAWHTSAFRVEQAKLLSDERFSNIVGKAGKNFRNPDGTSALSDLDKLRG
jgi:hypothetical protein